MKIIVVGGFSDSLLKFRGKLLQQFVDAGHEVHAMAGDENAELSSQLNALNIPYTAYPLQRTGLNPFADISTAWSLYSTFRKIKPDMVFSYTVKPVIWGSIAAKLAGTKHVHAMITGLGNQMVTTTFKQQFILRVVGTLYKAAFKCCDTVIFQNNDDRGALVKRSLLPKSKTHVVNGSGVELADYPRASMPANPPVFLTIARFLVAKGIREYAQAARIIKRNRPDVVFRVVGYEEVGDNAIPMAEIQALHDEGIIELVGRVESAYSALVQCHIYVLASFYGEGLPRTILEALAVGRPVLTTDNVGCREAVEHQVNGLLVEPRSAEALAVGMQWLLGHESQWAQMAEQSHRLALEKYDVDKVNQHMLRILGLSF